MKKLLIASLTLAPLLAVASADYNIQFYSQYNDPSAQLLQPNVLTLNKYQDRCIHSVEPGGGVIPYDRADINSLQISIVDSNEFPSCTNREKYQIWNIETNYIYEGMTGTVGVIKFKHWRSPTEGYWLTKIVTISDIPGLNITAECKVANTYKNCLSDSDDNIYGGLRNVKDIKITLKNSQF